MPDEASVADEFWEFKEQQSRDPNVPRDVVRFARITRSWHGAIMHRRANLRRGGSANTAFAQSLAIARSRRRATPIEMVSAAPRISIKPDGSEITASDASSWASRIRSPRRGPCIRLKNHRRRSRTASVKTGIEENRRRKPMTFKPPSLNDYQNAAEKWIALDPDLRSA